jgi:hypothetical protein
VNSLGESWLSETGCASVPASADTVSSLLSYLAAQARSQPAGTLRFVAGEIWRRGRARLHSDLAAQVPEVSAANFSARLPLFVPDASAASLPRGDAPWAVATIERARRICGDEFEVFGDWVALGPSIDWHRDWKSGHRWPLEPAGRLHVLDVPPGADVKRPWEVARFHQGLALGAAAALTRDQCYAEAFIAQARGWMASNPWPRGIHWAMPMEVALRAINWISAAALLSGAAPLDTSFSDELVRSLFVHGRHLWTYREWNPVARANHYLAGVVGLLWLGMLFEATHEGRQWLAFGRRELIAEMECQVGADGVAHEGSSGYHAFVTELFLTGALLLARHTAGGEAMNGDSAPAIERSCGPRFAQKLERMFAFLAALCAGREHPPVWGDADDGRVLPFGGLAPAPVSVLAGLGGTLYGHAAPPDGGTAAAEVFWRFGRVPDCGVKDRSAAAPPRSEAFAASGFFFFSSPRVRGSIRCGPQGVRGWANHAHNDQLSFEFALDGRGILVDPGLPCYSEDPAARNLFRSTRYHNTVEVAGAEQNRFWPALLFRIVDDTRSRVERWQTNEQGAAFAGVHHGSLRRPEKALVHRELLLEASDLLTVRDRVELAGPAIVTWYFHLAPGVSPEPLRETSHAGEERSAGKTLHSRWQLGPVVLSVWVSPGARDLAASAEMGLVAPRFGRKDSAPILKFEGRLEGKTETLFVFAPLKKEKAGAATGGRA